MAETARQAMLRKQAQGYRAANIEKARKNQSRATAAARRATSPTGTQASRAGALRTARSRSTAATAAARKATRGR